MDQVFTFDKSLQQRLTEYSEILSGFEVLPASALMKEWGFYLELTIDPNGWQAIWKIPRTTCETLKISFPTIVLVFVLNIDFSTLHALVKIIAVQDDIHIPEKQYVLLSQLWPTKKQDKTVALNISSTAESLDIFRFFYLYLFMPWDLDENSDWKTKHLESRLRLYYDMKNGVIPKVIAERLNSLMSEARRLQQKKESIESQLEDNVLEDNFSQEHVDILSDIHLRLSEIKAEIKILEKPLLRRAFIRRQEQLNSVTYNSREPRMWLIVEGSCTADNYIKLLEKLKGIYPNENITIQPNLCLTLENGGSRDCFILSDGTYEINTIGALENGGSMKGLGDRDNTTIISKMENIMFDFQTTGSVIANMTIDASFSQCASFIRRGKVTFSNCKIFGDGHSTIFQGFIVLDGAELELVDCELFGFYTAIVGNSGSKITLRNTDIHDVNLGLKIFDNTTLYANKCSFRNCGEFGVCIETKNNLDGIDRKIGNFDILNIVPQVQSEFLSGEKNNKGDVLINCSSGVEAVEDLFCDNDPTISNDLSEEMITENGSTDCDIDGLEKKRNISPLTI